MDTLSRIIAEQLDGRLFYVAEIVSNKALSELMDFNGAFDAMEALSQSRESSEMMIREDKYRKFKFVAN